MAQLTMAKALNEGLRKAMEDDPKVVLMGEDIGKLGGVFRITDGLQKDFGEDRVVDTTFVDSVEADADELAARIRKGCLEMPDPDPLSMFDSVYDEQTPLLAQEREEFSRYLAGFAQGAHA